jgi:hypothetical protein
MRHIATALALPLLAGSPVAAEPMLEQVGRGEPPALAAPGELPASSRTCRDTIIAVREERGLPPLGTDRDIARPAEPEGHGYPPLELRRDNAHPDEAEALMIYAVDREIDGCDVLVMAANPQDVRPLPTFEGPGRLHRIR